MNKLPNTVLRGQGFKVFDVAAAEVRYHSWNLKANSIGTLEIRCQCYCVLDV